MLDEQGGVAGGQHDASDTVRPADVPRFHRATFDRTRPERRQAVLDVAVDLFSTQGYAATSINDVARAAGISIGAMYSYFASKEDLFLTVIDHACSLMEDVLREVAAESADLIDYTRRMLAACREYGQTHAGLTRLYLSISTQALSGLSARVSDQLEATTPQILIGLIRDAQRAGTVRADADPQVWAMCIDDLFMMYQYSFASDYHRERLRLYLGGTVLRGSGSGAEAVGGHGDPDDPATVEAGILAFITAALRPS